jgi:hypothetical protein
MMADKPKVNADELMRLIERYDEMNGMQPLDFQWVNDSGELIPIDRAALDLWAYSGLGCRGFIEFVLFGSLEANTDDKPASVP